MGAIKETIEKTIPIKSIKSVLELGIGKGDFMETLMNCFDEETEFVGVDIVEEYITASLDRFKNQSNIKAMKMSADDLLFKDSSFDLVCISNTLHHLDDVEKVIKEMKRVVKPNGLILVHEMICDDQDAKQMVHVEVHHFCADIDMENNINHNYTYSTNDLKNLLNEQGLLIIYDRKYLVQDEQEMEDQFKTLDNIYSALKNNISKIDNTEKRDFYEKALEQRFNKYRDIGFALATEYIALLQK